MILLRKQQLEAIRLPQYLQFASQLVQDAREHFEEETAEFSDKELQGKITKGIKKAAIYGYADDQSTARFINVLICYGWDFDNDPVKKWMTAILEDPEISIPADRLNRLIEECAFREETEQENDRLREEFDKECEDLKSFDDNDQEDDKIQKNNDYENNENEFDIDNESEDFLDDIEDIIDK
ncbi:MAG TPA: hypothetical protein VHO70_11725 [Chitinispirillaceae bacterium]|nr:hypothetical protein [Chitinispirillaceae bacterium]